MLFKFKSTIYYLPTGFSRKNGFDGFLEDRRGYEEGVTLFHEMEFPREFGWMGQQRLRTIHDGNGRCRGWWEVGRANKRAQRRPRTLQRLDRGSAPFVYRDVVGAARRRGRVRVISRWTMASGRVVWIKLRVVQPPVLFSVSCAVVS